MGIVMRHGRKSLQEELSDQPHLERENQAQGIFIFAHLGR